MKLKEISYVEYRRSAWKNFSTYSFYDLNYSNHNTDGPAIIYQNGIKHWFTHGQFIGAVLNET